MIHAATADMDAAYGAYVAAENKDYNTSNNNSHGNGIVNASSNTKSNSNRNRALSKGGSMLVLRKPNGLVPPT